MLNFPYACEDVYSFENQEELQKAIDFDQIGQIYVDQDNKSITYKMDRSKSLRLSDLIFWIESDFVRIHLGQLLHLISNLLQKVQFIESKGIEHNYLDLNRIWLQIKQNSQYPCLIYQFFYYSIHFIGYQCPFYEKQNSQYMLKASLRINEIIQIIINKCFNQIRLKSKNTQKRNEIFKEILQPIIDLCKSNSTSNQIIAFIQEKLKKYNYQDDMKNKLVQSLIIDDNSNDYIQSQRHSIIENVNKDLKQIIEFGRKYGQIVIENLLVYNIPLISKHLKSYQKIKFEYQSQAQELYSLLQKKELQLNELVQNSMKSSLQEYEKQFKFKITQYEIQLMEQEIFDQIIKSKYYKYFNNTFWQYSTNQEVQDLIYAAISKSLIASIQVKLKFLFKFKTICLIDQFL
ncbi:unnamed protein product [Paramecium sonneborni]|uniref:Uncharacterized protein n=1 Tax=Paramecium sonneborni TaxID=65129 RepID=A0A8S1RH80_9CILI|nr:unnamed protein product [Paramecium sonneborni]